MCLCVYMYVIRCICICMCVCMRILFISQHELAPPLLLSAFAQPFYVCTSLTLLGCVCVCLCVCTVSLERIMSSSSFLYTRVMSIEIKTFRYFPLVLFVVFINTLAAFGFARCCVVFLLLFWIFFFSFLYFESNIYTIVYYFLRFARFINS